MSLQLVNYIEDGKNEGSQARVGALWDHRIIDFARVKKACATVQSECDEPEHWQTALGVVVCEDCLQAAREYCEWFRQQDVDAQKQLGYPVERANLLTPVRQPGKVFCLAGNFPEHVKESEKIIEDEVQQQGTPKVFMKPTPNTVCSDGDPINIGQTANFIDYEAELAVIIGRDCKYVEPEEAEDFIVAVSCFNDVSERQLDLWDARGDEEWDKFFYWLNGKWMDSFAPLGPCLVPSEDVELTDIDVKCLVNGELMQEGNTGHMFHSAAQTVSYISQMLTLQRGDVIALGTPAGVGMARDRKLVAGDEVTVSIDGVGELTNPVIAEPDG